jgi:hypothetical protein
VTKSRHSHVQALLLLLVQLLMCWWQGHQQQLLLIASWSQICASQSVSNCQQSPRILDWLQPSQIGTLAGALHNM